MKIALIENFGSDFYGARLRYALFLKGKGHEVIAIVPNDGYIEKIRSYGITTVGIDIDIRKRNLKTAITYGRKLKAVFKKEKFDIIHLYRMQPNLIGTPIAFLSSRKSKIINHITGLGVAFTQDSFKHKLMQFVIKSAYIMNHSWFNATLIFQNEEDKKELGDDNKFLVVKGSAVNEDKFNLSVLGNDSLQNELEEKYGLQSGITLIFVSRLLKQKGLSYLIQALKKYNDKYKERKLNLIVAGWIDPNNPDSFSEQEIEELNKVNRVAFLGKREDIDQLIALSDIATLPTFYREGTPRFLLEAMAMGKSILTTDMPGCNHLVRGQENGLLVNPKSTEQLVEAFEVLADKDLESMGKKSRSIYEQEFSEEVVYNRLLDIYKR